MANPVMRQCVGCHKVTDRTELVRCAYNAETDAIEVGLSHQLPGRGVWVHADPKCLQKGIRSRGFTRTLKLMDLSKTSACTVEAMQKLAADVLQYARCVLQQS
ncbi:hypothetical protein HMPREF0044_1002 [Gleimia coleocanis DSM 15436]|uniref:YlxR domain-containing protein n=1 Tax=Gleimia coleocanis DSM 15436 TaxID=525245 RepID=C0W0C4_9ACTO|nr:YlxR family protein [Gleimia coleocanis]EEH63983.1 hypothetical protein HMPREF0044_1002 [Gleimia coleocanis DSM 15436]